MIEQVTEDTVGIVVSILNESYRSGEGWTTEAGLVAGDRATDSVILAEMNSGTLYFIFATDDEAKGCFCLRSSGTNVEIGSLGVRTQYQGKGLGTLILSLAESAASQYFEFTHFKISVLKPRSELIEFYIRRGYSRTTETFSFPIDRGVGVPIVDNLQVVVLKKNA